MTSGDWLDPYARDERTVLLPRSRPRGGTARFVMLMAATALLLAGGMRRFGHHEHAASADRAPAQIEAVAPAFVAAPPSASVTIVSPAPVTPAASAAPAPHKMRKRRAREDAPRGALERLQRAQLDRATQ